MHINSLVFIAQAQDFLLSGNWEMFYRFFNISTTVISNLYYRIKEQSWLILVDAVVNGFEWDEFLNFRLVGWWCVCTTSVPVFILKSTSDWPTARQHDSLQNKRTQVVSCKAISNISGKQDTH